MKFVITVQIGFKHAPTATEVDGADEDANQVDRDANVAAPERPETKIALPNILTDRNWRIEDEAR